jgi:hypothetical protein
MEVDRSPKFIWTPCHVMCTAVLIGWDPASPPSELGLLYEGEGAIGQLRWTTSLCNPLHRLFYALQMKGRWESNINIWFPFMHSQKWNLYFQNRTMMFSLPVPTLIYLWEIYIIPGWACLFCCRKICGPILGIYKSLTDAWMWKLGLRPRNSQKRNT